jgi:NADPH2:quinone reductase
MSIAIRIYGMKACGRPLRPAPSREAATSREGRKIMEAYRAERLGGIEALARMDIPTPEPGTGQIRICVKAVGLNLADAAALAGERRPRPGLPLVPGFEAAGIVSAVGEGIDGFALGQPVVAFLHSGGLAREAIADSALSAALPAALTFVEAAGLPVAYAGGLMALRGRARLKRGETLLVFGGGSQAGLAAVELGKKLGAKVIAVAGQARRLETASAQGADHTIDAAASPLAPTVLDLTAGAGVDVIFDPVGGDGLRAALPALAEGARILAAGFAAGRVQPINARALHARDAAFISVNLPLMLKDDPAGAGQALRDVVAWTQAGAIRPRIAARFSFAQVRPAFDYVISRRDSGAVIVTASGD